MSGNALQTPSCTVSVIMAAYNARSFIAEAIDSVLHQTFKDWELIIVDDGSVDFTADYIAASYVESPQVKCHALAKNVGPSAARNFGISVATGRWVAILDSDDKFTPDRLEKLIAVCERESLDLIADNQLYFDDASKKIFQSALNLVGNQVTLSPEVLLRNDGPPLRFSFGALKPIVRREFLLANHISYPEDVRIGEDFVFLFQILCCGAKAWLVPDHLYVYTVPKVRAQAASEKTRTNYGKGNIETLIKSNADMGKLLAPDTMYRGLASLFRARHQRLSCALALREIRGMSPARAIRRLTQEEGWRRFFIDKLRNIFQRSHTVRGAAKR